MLQEIYRLGFPCALILEDDCVFNDDALEQLAAGKNEIQSADWDLLYLGCHALRDGPRLSEHLIQVLEAFHLHAYSVRREAIPKLVTAISHRLGTMDGVFDSFRFPGLVRLRFAPNLAIQEPGFSHTTGTQLDRTCQYDPAKDRLHALSVCVDFADRLARALPENLRHFDSWTVVTVERDAETRKLCERLGVRCILTDKLYLQGAKFDKGAAINDGLALLYDEHPDGWIAHVDADVVLPPDLKIKLQTAHLSGDCIYGMHREGQSQQEKWTNPISGFFQLWHARQRRFYRHHIDAGFTDTWFRDLWPADKQIVLPLSARHLGEPGLDWCGRVTPRLDENLVISREIGFGDTILSALFTAILRDNGIPALWWNHDANMRSLIDLPQWDGKSPAQHYVFEYESFIPGDRNFIRRALDIFSIRNNLRRPLKISRNSPPLRFIDHPRIRGADVAFCLTGGGWSRYRWFPRIEDLKNAMTAAGLTWIDLKTTWNQHTFNAIKKSRLYLGIDTGTTHAASALTSNGIILQSGFNRVEDWDHGYGFEILTADSACALAPCYLREGCPHDQRCMEIPIPRIIARIIERLKDIPAPAPPP